MSTLKKIGKVFGIILLVILAVITIFLCFPWVFTSSLVENKFPSLQHTLSSQETIVETVPSDWVVREVNGIKVSGPADAVTDKSRFVPFKRDGELTVAVISLDTDDDSDVNIDDYYSPMEKFFTGFLELCEDKCFKKLGYKPDEMTEYDRTAAMQNLTISQYKGTWGLNWIGFMYLAYAKELAGEVETLYEYELDGNKCFFSDYSSSKKYTYNYSIYVPGDKGCTVIVKSNDEKVVRQIISSIFIPDECYE